MSLQTRRLNQVRTRRSAFYGMSPTWVNDPATLPVHSPRIAWRDTARATDSRTCIVALVPPETVLVHQAYYLFFREGTATDEAYVLGVLSSLPFDWYMRLMVENHATVEIVLGSPVPRPAQTHPLRYRVVEIAGLLAAVDDRYAEWAAEVGVPVGSVATAADKDALIAELDALVGLLYGLDEDQIEHVFATFHRGWKYETRLDAVLKHFREWKRKA